MSTVSTFYEPPLKQSVSKREEFFIKNDELKNFKPVMSIDDTIKISENSDLFCNPSNFGYSLANGEFVFPNFTYPLCAENVKSPAPDMQFDYAKNIFSMKCEYGQPYYILEPTINKGRLFLYHEIKPLMKSLKYTKPVKLTTEEFALGSCDGKDFNDAIHFPRANPELYKTTAEKMKSLGQKHKPLIVISLTVDSFSRRHFYRKLPQTVNFLNKLDPKFSVFDFKIHNVFGGSSVENIVPIFSGNTYKDNKLTESEIPREYDVLGKDSMWSYFSSKGFVTLFGLENCDFYFPNAIGRYPAVNYTIRSFYCASKQFMNLDTDIDSKPVQRCLGKHMSHYYALNYTFEFSRLYSGVNQWVYLHLNAAHEGTGQHAATLDLDLVDFLKNYLNTFAKNHEIALFLHADHGMRYGNWYKDIEAYQENKLPALFFIGSKSLLDRIPFSFNNLLANTERLTTKKDLRPTINFLASMPYDIISQNRLKPYVNLFLEKASFNRSCEELKISPFDCSCLVLQEINDIEKNEEFYSLVLTIIQEAIAKMNYAVNTPLLGQFQLCQKLSFYRILKVYGLMLNNKVEELQIKFSVNESESAVFEVFAFVGTDPKSTVLIASGYRGPIISYVYRGYKTRIKIFGIKRKDPYAGLCETISRSLKIKAEYCICKKNAITGH